MGDRIKVTGMVLSAMPVGEYNMRVVILTTDRGRIHAFARGAKKPGSALMAACSPFVFGEFMVSQGRDAYNLISVRVLQFFEALRQDTESLTGYLYGCYFLEVADYFGRENADDYQMLVLLYQAVKALCKKQMPPALIRCVFDLKIMVINGEYPECFACTACGGQKDLIAFSFRRKGLICRSCMALEKSASVPVNEAAVYTLQYIIHTDPVKLFGFTVSPEVLESLRQITGRWLRMYTDREFKSLQLLELMADQ